MVKTGSGVWAGAASASAMLASALAFNESSVMDWAVRSARSGLVSASASAKLVSMKAFLESSVVDWAACSPSRSGR